ncbi:putative repeat protein (TIGR03943 family) [Nocardioides luteus]|uniref:Membrane protein n=1 Tax=Nocardioides luteus TaxID=1844 RepID=A0ABQ5T122_9ACTN|nr:TIGR03943 family protein [Nocardioides luteus]MDR7310783.1 putative repeat protein (TIGR03943 family) [Nocardioides luteus]GGR40661.1 membrane protein [Nocardioides luteus]GLJ69437.1 membrane protein [Nocardioides luteus]
MTRTTQALVIGFLGAVLLRLSLGDGYLRYVSEWMKWPLVATGVVLLGLTAWMLLRPVPEDGSKDGSAEDGPGHKVPAMTWLAILPGVIVFVASPPSLGAYLAERRAGDPVAAAPDAEILPLPASDGPVDVEVAEFMWRAGVEDGSTIEDRDVRLTGFVSTDESGSWYVTRIAIACCAADATASRVRVEGHADVPPRDSWVAVTGRWVVGSAPGAESETAIEATSVQPREAPANTYQ